MNLKESGRYSNFLNETIGDLHSLCTQSSYCIKTTQLHKKNKACKSIEDETIEINYDKITDKQTHELVKLMLDLINERCLLSVAIDEAKKSMLIDWKENNIELTFDAAVSYNKTLRNVASGALKYLSELKSSVTEGSANDYMINNEGNQVPFRYSVETTKQINYDRNVIRDSYKKTLAKADMISTKIEEASVKDVIHFAPKYDIHDSLEEIISKYA